MPVDHEAWTNRDLTDGIHGLNGGGGRREDRRTLGIETYDSGASHKIKVGKHYPALRLCGMIPFSDHDRHSLCRI